MAFTAITPTAVAVGAPLNNALMDLIRTNFDHFNGLVTQSVTTTASPTFAGFTSTGTSATFRSGLENTITLSSVGFSQTSTGYNSAVTQIFMDAKNAYVGGAGTCEVEFSINKSTAKHFEIWTGIDNAAMTKKFGMNCSSGTAEFTGAIVTKSTTVNIQNDGARGFYFQTNAGVQRGGLWSAADGSEVQIYVGSGSSGISVTADGTVKQTSGRTANDDVSVALNIPGYKSVGIKPSILMNWVAVNNAYYGTRGDGSSGFHSWGVRNASSGVCTELMNMNSSGTTALTAYSNGSVTFINGNGTISSSSDKRLKQEVKEHKLPGLPEVLRAAKTVVAYKWLSDIELNGDRAEIAIGHFAQDIKPIIPECVSGDEEKQMLSYNDRPMIAALLKAVEALNARLEALEGKTA